MNKLKAYLVTKRAKPIRCKSCNRILSNKKSQIREYCANCWSLR